MNADIKAAAERRSKATKARWQHPASPYANSSLGDDDMRRDASILADAMCARLAADEVDRELAQQMRVERIGLLGTDGGLAPDSLGNEVTFYLAALLQVELHREAERVERERPIDEAWIASMAVREPESCRTIGRQYVIGERVCYFFWPDGTVDWELIGGGECCGATRGQLLDLLAALGVKPTN
jgi:hypothetical protein